ncbi:hypothetical protein FQZ97_1161860 [compost metagenome]
MRTRHVQQNGNGILVPDRMIQFVRMGANLGANPLGLKNVLQEKEEFQIVRVYQHARIHDDLLRGPTFAFKEVRILRH